MLNDIQIFRENAQQDFQRVVVSPAANSVLGFDANKQPTSIPTANLPGLASADYYSPFEQVVAWLETARLSRRPNMVRPRELQEVERQLLYVSLA